MMLFDTELDRKYCRKTSLPRLLTTESTEVKISQMRKLSNSEVECNFARAASQRLLKP